MPNNVRSLTDRESDIIFLSIVFFFLRYMRRAGMQSDWQPKPVKPRESVPDSLRPLSVLFQLQDQANQDISSNGVDAIVEIIANHPQRHVLAKALTDEEIRQLFVGLSSYFSNQCEVAKSESWNPWDNTDPCDFALSWAFQCLSIIPTLAACEVIHTRVYIPWFEEAGHDERETLMHSVLQERGILCNLPKLLV